MLLDGKTKTHFFQSLHQLAETPITQLSSFLSSISAEKTEWRTSFPMNEILGNDDAVEVIWKPFKHAFPDLERRDLIFIGGEYEERSYIAALGHYCGYFEKDWLGIPANRQPIYIRYGEVYQIENGQIVQANLLWDVLDVIRQAGFWPLPPSLGVEGRWEGPFLGNGIQLGENDPQLSSASIQQTLDMHQTLFDYDQNVPTRDGLLNMEQKRYWHPKMMWFGPSGIGTTRTLQGFVDHHQLPFRRAFQRPKGTAEEIVDMREEHNAKHYVRFGDGPFSVTGGWPSFPAEHHGGSFLGTTATNKIITMRVMDFYHHHEGLIRENWVPIDILDVLNQMGFDVLERMHYQFKRGAI